MTIFWVTFLNYYALFLLLLLPFLLYFLFFSKKYWTFFWNISDLKEASRLFSLWKIIKFLWILLFISFTFLFSNPNLSTKNTLESSRWIDIQVVFDISYSMLAKDFAPNRINASKEILKNFVSRLENDRLWLILYSWKPFLFSPLTLDYPLFLSKIDDISVESIKQYNEDLAWTATWDALLLASNYFDYSSDREKVIILITDWNVSKWVETSKVAPYIAEKNIKVYWVWIWWESRIMVWEIGFDVEWLNPETLREIVEVTWWAYFRATENSSLEKIFDLISQLEKKEIILENVINYTKYYWPFQFIIVFLLTILLYLYRKKYV